MNLRFRTPAGPLERRRVTRFRAVVRPGITAAEQEGVVAFLETSEERNVGSYQRLGFAVEAEFPLPHGGP